MRRHYASYAAACFAVAGISAAHAAPLSTQQPQQPAPQQQQSQQAQQPQQQPQQQRQQQSQEQSGQQNRPTLQPPSASAAGGKQVVMTLVTSPSQIASSPSFFYGLPVSVHAPIASVMGPQVFTLDEDAWFGGPDVLVVIPQPVSGARRPANNEYVTVVGQVRPYVRAELERDFSWFDDLPDLNVDFTSRPVIIADIARTSDGTELARGNTDVTRVYAASPGAIAQTPGRFYGRSVSVRAEVEDVRSNRFFTLDEDELFAGPDVLVMNPYPAAAPEDGEMVTVFGTVRPFVRGEFERDYDWFDAAEYGESVMQYERRPVIVAHSIVGRNNREVVRANPGFTLERSEQALAGRGVRREQAMSGGAGAAHQPAGTTGQVNQSAAITDVNRLVGGTERSELIGRRVSLSNVQVQRVVDDRTVWVGPSPDRTVLVMAADASAQPTQGALTAGDRLTIEGTVKNAPASASGNMAGAPFFVHATRISRQ